MNCCHLLAALVAAWDAAAPVAGPDILLLLVDVDAEECYEGRLIRITSLVTAGTPTHESVTAFRLAWVCGGGPGH